MAQMEQSTPATWEAGYLQLKSIGELTLAKVNRLEEQMAEVKETLNYVVEILRTKLP